MLIDYLTPIATLIKDKKLFHANCLGNNIKIYDTKFPDLSTIDMAIVGIADKKGNINAKNYESTPDYIRKQLYLLHTWGYNFKIADIGNIISTKSQTENYNILSNVVRELLSQNIIPIILGGSHDLTYGQYNGYKSFEKKLNLVIVDSKIDFIEKNNDINNESFLYTILTTQIAQIFNFSLIGYQSYFVQPQIIAKMEQMHFDFYRLGTFRYNIEEVEPILRNADMLSFDITAIRQSDAPGSNNSSPNGFYAEEACQIMRYAGMSDKLTSIGFYEVNPRLDINSQTAQLVSQMIWYFVDGFYNRKNDIPLNDKKEFVKYIVTIKDNGSNLNFWKSKKSGRWWIELPFIKGKDEYHPHHLMPCSYIDYQNACKGEIPERWLKVYQKMSQS